MTTLNPITRTLARGLQSSRSFKLPTPDELTAHVAAAQARVPKPDEGWLDGGARYTAEEIQFMFEQELLREITPEK